MAYTVGASHGPFTGLGSFVIAKPAGIRTVITGIPAFVARDASLPTRYFRIGRYTLGNSHGYQNSVPIEYANQVAYPIAPDWELLAYDIRDGASCTFYELVAVPDLTAKQPWDRTPLPITQLMSIDMGGTTAETTGLSYTVPVGRKLHLGHGTIWAAADRAQGAGTRVYVMLQINGSRVIQLMQYGMLAGQRYSDVLGGGLLILNPGNTISAVYAASGVNGVVSVGANVSGFLFDA